MSLSPVLSEVLERVAHDLFVCSLTLNNKMSIHQSGNKQHHSTKKLGLLFTSHSLSAVDEKRVTGILMLDQSKTFDSAQHKILLANLNTLDVSPEALSWLESYHTDRQQFVQINSSRSNLLTVSRGVTQGSVLGPLLFDLYTNDLLCLKHLKCGILSRWLQALPLLCK